MAEREIVLNNEIVVESHSQEPKNEEINDESDCILNSWLFDEKDYNDGDDSEFIIYPWLFREGSDKGSDAINT